MVLGYISNEARQFHVYVANRVQLIRDVSSPDQWHYVDTHRNPADLATRFVSASDLMSSVWLSLPSFLHETYLKILGPKNKPDVVSYTDPEVRQEFRTLPTTIRSDKTLGTRRLSRLSKWTVLCRALAKLIVFVRRFRRRTTTLNSPLTENLTPELVSQAEIIVVRCVQQEAFLEEIGYLRSSASTRDGSRAGDKRTFDRKFNILPLDPFVDSDGILRVGGRLRRGKFDENIKHPILFPNNHHVTDMLVRHSHRSVHHEERGRLMAPFDTRDTGLDVAQSAASSGTV